METAELSRSDPLRARRRARPRVSLKMQAIGYLSRREHSRQELRAKLLSVLRQREREDAVCAAALARQVTQALRQTPANGIDEAFAPRTTVGVANAHGLAAHLDAGGLPGASVSDRDATEAHERAHPEAAVDELLDWLVANQHLSDSRFIESRVHVRARKQGATMIRHELARHGLALDPGQAAALRDTEFTRAQALWQRRFGERAADARGRAKQARFLVARGFASDVVRRIVGGIEES